MPQDTVDDAVICNKGDDEHARPAAAKQGIRLEDFRNQASPRAPGFPEEIRSARGVSLPPRRRFAHQRRTRESGRDLSMHRRTVDNGVPDPVDAK